MSDGSEEVTASRDPASTDDLLEETEQLLSGEGGGEGVPGAHEGSIESRERGVPGRHGDAGDGLDDSSSSSWFGFGSGSDDATETDTEPERSRTRQLLSRLSPTRYLAPTRYFSPKAFLALVFVLGAGVFAGGTFVPLAGRILGMFAAAFLVGLITSKRRYLEMTAAGTSVGAVAAFFNYAVFTLVDGGGSVVAIGTTAGAVACLFGYYFGRDLRDGFLRDL